MENMNMGNQVKLSISQLSSSPSIIKLAMSLGLECLTGSD